MAARPGRVQRHARAGRTRVGLGGSVWHDQAEHVAAASTRAALETRDGSSLSATPHEGASRTRALPHFFQRESALESARPYPNPHWRSSAAQQAAAAGAEVPPDLDRTPVPPTLPPPPGSWRSPRRSPTARVGTSFAAKSASGLGDSSVAVKVPVKVPPLAAALKERPSLKERSPEESPRVPLDVELLWNGCVVAKLPQLPRRGRSSAVRRTADRFFHASPPHALRPAPELHDQMYLVCTAA